MKVEFGDTAHRRALRGKLLVAALLVWAPSCSTTGTPVVPDPIPDDRRDIPKPEYRKILARYNGFDNQVARPFERALDFSRQLRRLAGKKKEAYNVDAFDEVRDSSWFTNRNARRPLTLEAIKRGPNTVSGPDPAGPWTIVAAKSEGITPGFTIKDPEGTRYVIKFDPVGWSELATGAEVVSTKLFYAMGYNTPENYIVYFRPDILRLGEEVMIKTKATEERLMVEQDLEDILSRIEVRQDSTIRATASKYLQGDIIGPFAYRGTRRDDPNDFIPHEHRRELRGLRILSAWLNHYDTKANNSMDVYVRDGERRYVRHYLLDFGSTLGSAAHGPMPIWGGYENAVDTGQMIKNTLGVGLYVPAWEKGRSIRYTSVGLFDWNVFDPTRYQPINPNPAFVNLTERDGFWAAKIAMSLTDDQIRAAIETGEYSDPQAAAYLLEVIRNRRDIIGRRWFDRMTPVDRFEVSDASDGAVLQCVDLAVESGLHAPSRKRYLYDILQDGRPVSTSEEAVHPVQVPLPNLEGTIEVRLRCQIGDGEWTKPVSAYLTNDGRPGSYTLLAVERRG